MVERFEVWNINLSPTVGHEINKLRPCVIISPNEANKYLKTVIIAPLTSTLRNYPTRVNCIFQNRKGQVALDQIRTVDSKRLTKKLGLLAVDASVELCNTLQQMFKY